jgi:hypothetical protein
MTANKTKSAPYKVGYGKPPRHTQFRKGQSGNLDGRPPRVVSRQRMKAMALKEAYRAIVVTEDGRAAPVPAIQAILRSQIELAAKGNIQAQRAVLAAVRTFEEELEVDVMVAATVELADRVIANAQRRRAGGEPGTGTCGHETDAEESP